MRGKDDTEQFNLDPLHLFLSAVDKASIGDDKDAFGFWEIIS